MSFKFKGFSWTELAECWGIKVEEVVLNYPVIDEETGEEVEGEDLVHLQAESIDVVKYVNGMKVVFTIEDEEEVLAEKLKRYISEKLRHPTTDPDERKQIREDMNNFLRALIQESETLDYNAPVFEGILAIESDFTFSQWFCNNLESLWT